MTALIETIASYWYVFLNWFKKNKQPVAVQPAPVVTPPVTVETDEHPPTEPITVDVTVNEEKKETPVEANQN